jgi:S1-C subfamily serine protease
LVVTSILLGLVLSLTLRTSNSNLSPDAAKGSTKAESSVAALIPAVLTLESFDSNGQSEALGSGFIVSANGVGVTNWHVIAGATGRVRVTTAGGAAYTLSEISGFDRDADLVVFRFAQFGNMGDITYPAALPVIPLAASTSLNIGDPVWTIGSPEGLSNSVSDGLLSATRNVEGRRYLQISAPVSHGSSGGPVVSAQGKVIGVIRAGLRPVRT